MKCHRCETFLNFHPLYYETNTEYLWLTICAECFEGLPTYAHDLWNLRFNCPMDAPKVVSS